MDTTRALDGAIELVPLGITPDLEPLLGDPPIADGEDINAYIALWNRFYAALEPRDILDIIATRDQVDLTWRILGLRKLQAALIRNARPEAARRLLSDLMDDDGIEDIAEDLARAPWSSSTLARPMLESLSISLAQLDAEALSIVLPHYVEIDMMMLRADTMRTMSSRERERRLEGYVRRLRAEAEMIEAEYEFDACLPRLTPREDEE